MSTSVLIEPSLTLKRRLKASPSEVYAAWTDPRKIVRWFGPDSGPVEHAELDVRVGGRYSVSFRTEDGEQHYVSGVYREVVPNEKLSFTWAWRSMPERESLVTVSIKPDGDGSLLTLQHEKFFDEPARDRHREGWSGCLDKLERYLAGNDLPSPRFERGRPMVMVGLRERYTSATRHKIPDQWRRFAPRLGEIEGRIGNETFGAVSLVDADFDYLTAIHVADLSGVPDDFVRMTVPARRYAVFTHDGPISEITNVMNAIERRLPQLGLEVGDAPQITELYGESFDPETGTGGFEIWIALKE
jgi:uncharacterized protein YndB with AHSA1/START domain/predicted transcriptional regulator YdeE